MNVRRERPEHIGAHNKHKLPQKKKVMARKFTLPLAHPKLDLRNMGREVVDDEIILAGRRSIAGIPFTLCSKGYRWVRLTAHGRKAVAGGLVHWALCLGCKNTKIHETEKKHTSHW